VKTPIRFPFTLFCAATASLLGGLALSTPAHAAKSPASLTWSAARYDFGSVSVGQTPSQTLTLSNTGGRSSGMITVTLSGSPVFTIIADGCTGKALRANKSCDVTVKYPPINTNGDAGTLAATGKRSSAMMSLNGNGSARPILSEGVYSAGTAPIQGAIVGQYFGLFDGVSKERYQRIVAAAPFDKCNLLILAFVRTFEFNRPQDQGGPIYVAQFPNVRDDERGGLENFPLDPNDTDGDRVKLIVETARKKNPSINILITLGSGDEDLKKAAATPVAFADSVRALVQAYDLNGFDIDFESTTVEEQDMLTLAKEIRRSLNKIPSTRPMIMTIAPDQTGGLNQDVLEQFTYVMAQTYGHRCSRFSFDDTKLLAEQLGSYERIVYGVNSEGPPDNPKDSTDEAKKNHAAGIFAWRLDNDSSTQLGYYPTFANAVEMWNLMNQQSAAPEPKSPRSEPHSPRDQRRVPFSQP
jgi:hypothetical protein